MEREREKERDGARKREREVSPSLYKDYSCLSMSPSVCPLREVSGNNLIPRNKRLCLWPLSNRS